MLPTIGTNFGSLCNAETRHWLSWEEGASSRPKLTETQASLHCLIDYDWIAKFPKCLIVKLMASEAYSHWLLRSNAVYDRVSVT